MNEKLINDYENIKMDSTDNEQCNMKVEFKSNKDVRLNEPMDINNDEKVYAEIKPDNKFQNEMEYVNMEVETPEDINNDFDNKDESNYKLETHLPSTTESVEFSDLETNDKESSNSIPLIKNENNVEIQIPNSNQPEIPNDKKSMCLSDSPKIFNTNQVFECENNSNETKSKISEINDRKSHCSDSTAIHFDDLTPEMLENCQRKVPNEDNNNSNNSKVAILERVLCRYFCTLCYQFSSESALDFNKHLAGHRHKKELNCVYCCCNIHISKATRHFDQHFSDKYRNIEECVLCKQQINVSSVDSVLAHIRENHSSTHICPVCMANFVEEVDLNYHIMGSITELFKCGEKDCSVITHNDIAFNNHLKYSEHNANKVVNSYFMNCKTNDYIEDCCIIKKRVRLNVYKPTEECQAQNITMSNGIIVESSLDYQLDYSVRVLRKIFGHMNEETFNNLKVKMDCFKELKMRIGYIETKKWFFCIKCDYRSQHSSSDLRKHLMGVHCNVPNQMIRDCLQACKLSPSMKLLTDRELISAINTFRNSDRKKKDIEIALLSDSEDEKPNLKLDYCDNNKLIALNQQVSNVDISKTSVQKKSSKILEITPVYSEKVLKILCENSQNRSYYEMLVAKLTIMSKYSAAVVYERDQRYLLCNVCKIKHYKKYTDLFKHWMRDHAEIPINCRDIVKAASSTDNRYKLLSDEALLNKAAKLQN